MIYKSVKDSRPHYLSNRFFENQPNEIYSHLSEKALKGRFLKLEKEAPKSQQERKRKGEKKERGEGKEENRKKSNGCTPA